MIERMPRSPDRQCLATVRFRPSDETTEAEIRSAAAIGRRRTERLPMAAPTELQETVAQLQELAERTGAHLGLIGEHERPALDTMSRRIRGVRRADHRDHSDGGSGHVAQARDLPDRVA